MLFISNAFHPDAAYAVPIRVVAVHIHSAAHFRSTRFSAAALPCIAFADRTAASPARIKPLLFHLMSVQSSTVAIPFHSLLFRCPADLLRPLLFPRVSNHRFSAASLFLDPQFPGCAIRCLCRSSARLLISPPLLCQSYLCLCSAPPRLSSAVPIWSMPSSASAGSVRVHAFPPQPWSNPRWSSPRRCRTPRCDAVPQRLLSRRRSSAASPFASLPCLFRANRSYAVSLRLCTLPPHGRGGLFLLPLLQHLIQETALAAVPPLSETP